jgi:pyruvate dehydrogenase E1 component alpha subunit
MDYRDHPLNRDLTPDAKVQIYRQMVRIRRFEQEAMKYYISGKMGGLLPLDIGQESISVGVRTLVGPEDHAICGWRGIGHALAAGMEMGPCMAELYGKAAGASGGKGGAMSLFVPSNRFWGSYPIAGAQTPLAAGLAFALKLRGIQGAVICFLGDGTVNQGVYHETLNLAGLFDLPVVFVIENNRYAMGTSQERSSRFKECLARRADTYDIAWDITGDGDLYELRARVGVLMERARRESKPAVIEIPTYRYFGFTVSDANHKKYRTPEEIEFMKQTRDPITRWRQQLEAEGLMNDELANRVDAEAKVEAMQATGFAEAAPPPTVEDVMSNVYWETDHSTPASKIGRHFF